MYGAHAMTTEAAVTKLMWALGDLSKATGNPATAVRALAKRGLVRLEEREIRRDPLAGRAFASSVRPEFTADQEAAWHEIDQALQAGVAGQVMSHTPSVGNGDPRRAQSVSLHQAVELGSIVGMQPDATMRGGAPQALDITGRVDGIAAEEED